MGKLITLIIRDPIMGMAETNAYNPTNIIVTYPAIKVSNAIARIST